MIYIYDQIVDKDTMEFEYLGDEYKLKGVTKTKNSYYLTYMAKGREPLLVIPTFAAQFLDFAKKFQKIKDCTTDHNVRLRMKRTFKDEPYHDSYELAGVTTHSYSLDYKSIRVHMVLNETEDDGHFFLLPEFTIMKDNIFGNGNDVDVRNNDALYKYCEEG